MYRFKTLTGNCLWARHIDAQATEVSVRVGVIKRMADLARPQFIRIACNDAQRCHCARVRDLCNNATRAKVDHLTRPLFTCLTRKRFHISFSISLT
ncbi:MAG: hypothetical protein E5299_02504 [Burkholderia gladioli]|nr:MAG: hypothetical protein E5299_02504 [Burkholderia gladioli]